MLACVLSGMLNQVPSLCESKNWPPLLTSNLAGNLQCHVELRVLEAVTPQAREYSGMTRPVLLNKEAEPLVFQPLYLAFINR